MNLSLIIPAFNEEAQLPGCLAAAHEALENAAGPRGWEWEVVVCDNNSTDRTLEVARETGARVVFEPINQISRARNAGAAAAGGDWFLFIDADSRLSAGSLAGMLEAAESGETAGGGCTIAFFDAPWSAKPPTWAWNRLSRMVNWAAGSFVFASREAFEAVGGFPGDFFAAEEIEFSRRMKRWAKDHGMKFRVLPGPSHASSGRKFHLYTTREQLTLLAKCALFPLSTLRKKESLDYYYDGRR